MSENCERIRIGDFVTIYPRGKKKVYTADICKDGKHSRRTLATTQLKIAKERGRRLDRDVADGLYEPLPPKSAPATTEQAIDEFCTFLKTEQRRRKTLTKYRGVLLRKFMVFAREEGKVLMRDVDLRLIDRYRAAQVDQISPRSMHNEGVILKTFLGWCVDRDLLPHNPLAKQKFRRPKHEPVGGPTLAQIDAILAAATPARLAPLAMLAFTGMRAGECQHLLPEDVDLKNGWIHIVSREGAETKTGESRKVPVHPRLAAFLAQLPRPRGKWYFTSQPSRKFPQGGHHLSMKRINEDFQRLLVKLEIPVGKKARGFTLHSLRSSFKTIGIHAGIPREVVDHWQGHASGRPRASDAYYQLSDEESQRFMLQLPFGNANPPGVDGGVTEGS